MDSELQSIAIEAGLTNTQIEGLAQLGAIKKEIAVIATEEELIKEAKLPKLIARFFLKLANERLALGILGPSPQNNNSTKSFTIFYPRYQVKISSLLKKKEPNILSTFLTWQFPP